MAFKVCAHCGKRLAECCDLFEEAQDENGNDVVICFNCIQELGLYDEKEGENNEDKAE